MEAEIILEYADVKFAEAIGKSVSPDNFKTPHGLSIKTIRQARRVVTRIEYDGRFPTFIATIDDLLFSASAAEKALQTTKKLE